ncbi:hypothetical protein M885DRAFT_511377 [Pelagophyceae sp. CCMP2097]|nr:hypothetical protein M885DRAFT_511377 [Pelagophyceae sp. CCMP2097]
MRGGLLLFGTGGVPADDCDSFSALTYNILARSLGSNTIPWILQVAEPMRLRVEAKRGTNWATWKKECVEQEYKQHWHKNLASGDYAAMRLLWGRRVFDDGDLPETLRDGVRVVGEDALRLASGGEAFRTLRGVLRASLGPELGLECFEDIVSREELVYAWETRGPKIFKEAAAAYDVAVLLEYDCHDAVAAYDGAKRETFASAMRAAGFDGIFASDPLLDREPPSGLALFWRRNKFELAPADGAAAAAAGLGVLRLACGDSLRGAAWNVDLEECVERDGVLSAMPAADRRNALLARLRLRETGDVVNVVAAHLMTTSRDAGGGVRARELRTIRRLALDRATGDALVCLGDFNTLPSETAVFTGAVAGVEEAGMATTLASGQLKWSDDASGAAIALRDAFEDDHAWGADAALLLCGPERQSGGKRPS